MREQIESKREAFVDYVTFCTFHNSLFGKFLHTTTAWCSYDAHFSFPSLSNSLVSLQEHTA